MELALWQVIVLSLYSGFSMLDALSFGFGFNGIIQSGIFAGLIVGDIETGLRVGGTLQSFALGIGTYGGASIPNYASAAIIVTALAGGMENAETYITAVGVPIAALTVQFDILGRFTNTVFQHMADSYVEKGDLRKIELMNWLGCFPWALSRIIPVFLALALGGPFVQTFIDNVPTWVVSGFSIAGKLLPAVGFTILLKYLPTVRNISYLILGFVLSAYLGLDVLAVALIGLSAAILVFKKRTEVAVVSTGGDDYDE